MKLAHSKSLIAAVALGLTLTLAGCSTAEEPTVDKTPTPSATPTPGSETITGSSDDVADVETTLVPTETAPEWAASVLAPIPADWFYMSDDTQAMAIVDSYDQATLEAFVNAKLADGWAYDVDPTIDAEGYVATLYRGSDGEYITVVGATTGAPAADGSSNSPASSIIYSR